MREMRRLLILQDYDYLGGLRPQEIKHFWFLDLDLVLKKNVIHELLLVHEQT